MDFNHLGLESCKLLFWELGPHWIENYCGGGMDEGLPDTGGIYLEGEVDMDGREQEFTQRYGLFFGFNSCLECQVLYRFGAQTVVYDFLYDIDTNVTKRLHITF